MLLCPESVDGSFGPWAGPDCRGGLDFTFLFELIFFSLLPAAVFIGTAIWQCWKLQRNPKLVHQGKLRFIKLVCN